MKKIFIISCIILLLTGCGKKTENKKEVVKKETVSQSVDTYQSYYGTWKVSAVENSKGAVISVSEAEALGDYSLSEMYFVIKKGGTVIGYAYNEDSYSQGTWSEDNGCLLVNDHSICKEENTLKFETDNGKIYLMSYSKSQDITDLPHPVKETIEESVEEELSETEEKVNNSIRPEFKELMDSYEAFFDEYIAFMKEYEKAEPSTTMMMKYLTYLEKYTEALEALDEIEDEDLNSAEVLYYTEVTLRIEEKLLKALQ